MTEITEENENFNNMIRLTENGKPVFDIIYPSNSRFTNARAMADQVKRALESKTGVTFSVYDDTEAPRKESLILIGDTHFEESVSELNLLGAGGYSATVSGKHIVIQAGENLTMIKAVNWFCNTLLPRAVSSADGASVRLTFEENRYMGETPERQLRIAGIPLAQYRIVYPSGNTDCQNAAKRLASELYRSFGVSLQIVSDETPEAQYEFLVGNTGRAESETHRSLLQLRPTEYEYRLINAKLSIMAYSNHGYGIELSCGSFVENLASDSNINLEGDFMLKTNTKLQDDAYAAMASGADVRIMTANILSEEWGGTECMPRAELLYANLMYYLPDVIGMQEVSVQWTQSLQAVLQGGEYTVLHDVVDGTESNYCPLVYRSATVEVVESGAYRYAIGGPSRARTVTWGVFRHKTTGKIFAVLNTHLDWTKTPDDFTSTESTTPYSREQQVRALAQTYLAIAQQYPDADIVMTADWNTGKDKHPLNILTELTSAQFAQDLVPENDWGNQIDHILVSEHTKVVALHLYRENSCDLGITDHPWGFADIQLRSYDEIQK